MSAFAAITTALTTVAPGLEDPFGAVLALPGNPNPQAPPGAQNIENVLGYIKWGAGAAIVAGFFAGVALFAGGRIADHHRFGRMGAITMFASVGAAFLYAIGYSVLTTFAAG
ncbi:hypothetical protein [Pseudonocardia sp. WMMC193]|uniref:hypothetical protein n=1 Tax=Pseudonocardia sp. WMMC193 TaxID=2911965 RepID=UPI001F378804|nr:hypothetical protein [Pseudonocardia sp. WMMC193]MCF7547274.1 hypothetical protein [Pseudonocardia sp. WMMC193]MCF7547369.1 hypothetical protein [Pseudonocardia sp. WMMC193]